MSVSTYSDSNSPQQIASIQRTSIQRALWKLEAANRLVEHAFGESAEYYTIVITRLMEELEAELAERSV